MELLFQIRPFEIGDLNNINEFVVNNDWHFHNFKITEPKTLEYFLKDVKTLIATNETGLLGYVRIEEFIDGDSPLFDIRIKPDERGKGLGEALMKYAETTVFTELPHTVRFEGTTRVDNAPMISLFEKLNWTKESHYRMGWRLGDYEFCDALGYSILREEWERR
jgi:RimJ/RimL family protein N-acetyltransferase